MTLKISFQKTPKTRVDTIAVAVFQGNKLSESAQKLNRQEKGAIHNHLKKQKKFKGNAGQILTLPAAGKSGAVHIVLMGLGEIAKLDATACEKAGGQLYPALAAMGARKIALHADSGKDGAEGAAHIAMGLLLRSYRFDKYKSKPKDNAPAYPETLEIVGTNAPAAAKIFAPLGKTAQGMFLARDLVNEPPNVLYPESFARRVQKELKPLGISVQVFDDKQLKSKGHGAHMAVGQGSARPPRMVVMRWNGAGKNRKKKSAPLAFVGKGVTFDTGGINLKPTGSVEDMKMDMGGAAAVVGLMKTLALRKAKIDVVGVIGLAENMPSHMSYRPSDILKSLSGKTIEVLNTDAEGRLVLADCLTYVQKTYKPCIVIDLATLTGAMMIALGAEYCGTFVNDNALWKAMKKAGEESGERLWRMPLDEAFKKSMEGGTLTDLRNTSTMGRYAGSCTAAGFLEHFIEKGTPWAHMDIAGVAWVTGDKPTCPKPATGFGVRILDRLVAGHYETGA